MRKICFTSWSLVLAFGLPLAFVSGAFAQTSTPAIPVVTIEATDAQGTWAGDPAVFTVYRHGNPTNALNVYCCISGTATNGVDYSNISSFVSIPAFALSNNVVIHPINLGQTDTRTVVLSLCPSPLLGPATPVNYSIGSPSNATVYITPPGVTNLPPSVSIFSPVNGAVFYTPTNISLLAKAGDPDGTVTSVEFFANGADLGPGQMVVLDGPGVNGVTGPVWFFNWSNVQSNKYALTAVATDNGGASTTSDPVNITVLPGPPPTNRPPVVRISSPPNGSVFRAPVNLPLLAYAADPDGYVASVEFFANSNSLGFGRQIIPVPYSAPGSPAPATAAVGSWELVWTNPPPGTNIALTAQATDNGGASTLSLPVLVTILPPLPPPTNRPDVVSIVATDPVAIEGTNCWPWLGLVGATPTWSNWVSPTAVCRFFTNCGPKDATITVFRFGATNDDLTVNYAVGGTAVPGVDYLTLPGLVTIPAGTRRADITIVPLDDGPPDLTSTVVIKLQTGTNYLIGVPKSAAAIILDGVPPRATAASLPGNCFHLSATGPDGAWFHVESSSDMLNWTPICTNQVVNGAIDFLDPDAATNPAQFYRAVPESGPPQ